MHARTPLAVYATGAFVAGAGGAMTQTFYQLFALHPISALSMVAVKITRPPDAFSSVGAVPCRRGNGFRRRDRISWCRPIFPSWRLRPGDVAALARRCLPRSGRGEVTSGAETEHACAGTKDSARRVRDPVTIRPKKKLADHPVGRRVRSPSFLFSNSLHQARRSLSQFARCLAGERSGRRRSAD